MQRIGTWLAMLIAVLVAALAVTNWPTLAAPTDVNLLVTQAQVPLGLLMLGLTTALFALFVVVTLRSQIGALLESRRLLKDVQRLQGLADQAEASRIQNLHQLISTEFRLLHERLGAAAPATDAAELPLVRLP